VFKGLNYISMPPAFLAEVRLKSQSQANHTLVLCRLSGHFNNLCILFCSFAQCTYTAQHKGHEWCLAIRIRSHCQYKVSD